jgi:hypothetical protein
MISFPKTVMFIDKVPGESEGKRKSALTFVTAHFFLVERSIYPPGRTNLIWEGLGEVERLELG